MTAAVNENTVQSAAPTLPRTTSTSLSMVLPNVLEIIRFNNDILHRDPSPLVVYHCRKRILTLAPPPGLILGQMQNVQT